MAEIVRSESPVFFSCFIAGIFSGCIFDFFKILRKTLAKNYRAINLCDALFWIFFTVFFIYWLYSVNDGALRWYVFASFILGAYLYFCLFSKIFVSIGIFVLKLIFKIIYFMLKLFIIPFKYIAKKTGHAFVLVFSPVRNLAKKIRILKRLLKRRWKLSKK